MCIALIQPYQLTGRQTPTYLFTMCLRVLDCAFDYNLSLTVPRWPSVVDRTLKSNYWRTNHSNQLPCVQSTKNSNGPKTKYRNYNHIQNIDKFEVRLIPGRLTPAHVWRPGSWMPPWGQCLSGCTAALVLLRQGTGCRQCGAWGFPISPTSGSWAVALVPIKKQGAQGWAWWSSAHLSPGPSPADSVLQLPL